MFKRLLALVLTLAVLTCIFTSCSEDEYFGHCELRISLDGDFYEYGGSDTFDVCYTDGSLSVGIGRLSFVLAESQGISIILTPYYFAEYYVSKTEYDGEIYMHGDVPYFTYYVSDGDTDTEYFCMLTFYRSFYAYFAVLYMCSSEYELQMRERMLEYAASVVFSYEQTD